MIARTLNAITKRQKFSINAFLFCAFLYLVSMTFFLSSFQLLYMAFVFVLGINFIVHYPNVSVRNMFMVSVLSFSLLIGEAFFLRGFPNFTLVFKLGAIFGGGILQYLILLATNIFLVVRDKEEAIPLYRVAVTWSQILVSLVAIPLFVGLAKLPVNAFLQTALFGLLGFIFSYYQIRFMRFDPDTKKVRVGEIVGVCVLSMFALGTFNLSLSFIPSEAFLRALAATAMLMFLLGYISGHLKNSIDKKLLVQHAGLILFFVSIVFLFRR
jgi:hypothetical protein